MCTEGGGCREPPLGVRMVPSEKSTEPLCMIESKPVFDPSKGLERDRPSLSESYPSIPMLCWEEQWHHKKVYDVCRVEVTMRWQGRYSLFAFWS